jgi:hypothetical protein
MTVLDSLTEQEWASIKDEVGRYPAVKVSGAVLTLVERRDSKAA